MWPINICMILVGSLKELIERNSLIVESVHPHLSLTLLLTRSLTTYSAKKAQTFFRKILKNKTQHFDKRTA